VESLKFKCAISSLPINYELLFISKRSYDREIERVKASINVQEGLANTRMTPILPLNSELLANMTTVEKDRYLSSYRHENFMFQLQHYKCIKCQSVSMYKIHSKINANTPYVCSQCAKKPDDFFVKQGSNRLLPVWFDDVGQCHYELPDELVGLRLGEKLLIQRYSCFVPIVHIKNGIMGIKGHCCCFKQDICDMATTLPRLKVNAIKVVKGVKNSAGFLSEISFIVRKDRVMSALFWLKKYHKWYRDDKDLIICEENLNWMNGNNECELDQLVVIDEFEDECDITEPGTGYVSQLNNTSISTKSNGTLLKSRIEVKVHYALIYLLILHDVLKL
jgi:hypothetical protein